MKVTAVKKMSFDSKAGSASKGTNSLANKIATKKAKDSPKFSDVIEAVSHIPEQPLTYSIKGNTAIVQTIADNIDSAGVPPMISTKTILVYPNLGYLNTMLKETKETAPSDYVAADTQHVHEVDGDDVEVDIL